MVDNPNINPYQAAKDGGGAGKSGAAGKATRKGNGAEHLPHGQQSTTLQVALDFVALTGAPVFPVGGDKKALIKGWPEKASREPEQLEAWAKRFPRCMWAMPAGPKSGISLIDLDKAKDEGGQSGIGTWQAIRQRHPDLSQLKPPVVLTAGGGAHLYFAHVDGAKNSAGQIGPGVDVRGEGGYVVIPGSVNDDGKAYGWMEDREFSLPLPPFPLDIVIAEIEANKAAESERKQKSTEAARAAAPSSVGQKVREQQEKLRAAHGAGSDGDASGDAIDAGRRKEFVSRVFGNRVGKVATAPKGTRNPALNRAALILGHYVASGDLSESEVIAALKAAAEACGLTADDGIKQVEKTITSGLEAGKRDPWDGKDDKEKVVGAIDPERASTGQSRANGAQPGEKHGKQNGADGDVRTINGHEWSDSYGPGPGAGHGVGDDGAARDPGSGGERSGNGGGRGSSANESEPWPDPMTIETPPPSVMRLDAGAMLSPDIAGYVRDVSRRQQCPPEFAAVGGICGLAATLGNHIVVGPKQNDPWIVIPNLWGMCVGRPSSMKSPAIKAALEPLHKLEADLIRTWKKSGGEARVEAKISEMKAKAAQAEAKAAFDDGDEDRVREILLALEEAEAAGGSSCPRLMVNDATVEKLGELLNENPRGLLLVRDELAGFLLKMNESRYQSDRAFYLEAFNGDASFTYDRIERGTVRVERATLSIVGSIQPSRLASIVTEARNGSLDDGLIQRFQLAVLPDEVADYRWVDEYPAKDALDAYENTFQRLYQMASKYSATNPLVLRFSPEAQEAYRRHCEGIQSRCRRGGLSPAFESHLGKMPKTVASLALLFELCACDGVPFDIGLPATEMAIRFACLLESHAGRIYGMEGTAADAGARLIFERRKRLPRRFTIRDVMRKMWAGLGDRDAVDAAIARLEETHNLREVVEPSGPEGGRPTRRYEWHPAHDFEKGEKP